MNNLHRKLAPISEGAWAQIEEEAVRTLKRYLAARKVVDVDGPNGFDLSAVGTGHIQPVESPGEGVQAAVRKVNPVVEFRVPFELTREAIDDVERGSEDSDWQPLKDAAEKIAFAEDRAIFKVMLRQAFRVFVKAAAIVRSNCRQASKIIPTQLPVH